MRVMILAVFFVACAAAKEHQRVLRADANKGGPKTRFQPAEKYPAPDCWMAECILCLKTNRDDDNKLTSPYECFKRNKVTNKIPCAGCDFSCKSGKHCYDQCAKAMDAKAREGRSIIASEQSDLPTAGPLEKNKCKDLLCVRSFRQELNGLQGKCMGFSD